MNIIDSLTSDEIQNGKFPLEELLENSLYYPSSGFDGGVVKHFSKEVQSFIFCDYATSKVKLLDALDKFHGYRIFASRPLSLLEVYPKGYAIQPPPNFNLKEYTKYKEIQSEPFVHWAVYERVDNFDETHGPKRFSLLYIGGEGVAAYQSLYWITMKTAKILAIIQPGTGFGGNWTDFKDKKSPLAWAVLTNTYGTPETIIYGGIGKNYTDLNWDGYVSNKTISPYYHGLSEPYGEVTVWIRE